MFFYFLFCNTHKKLYKTKNSVSFVETLKVTNMFSEASVLFENDNDCDAIYRIIFNESPEENSTKVVK